jgi:hypothetical protein
MGGAVRCSAASLRVDAEFFLQIRTLRADGLATMSVQSLRWYLAIIVDDNPIELVILSWRSKNLMVNSGRTLGSVARNHCGLYKARNQ